MIPAVYIGKDAKLEVIACFCFNRSSADKTEGGYVPGIFVFLVPVFSVFLEK